MMFEITYKSKGGITITDYRQFADHSKALVWIRRKCITEYILKPTDDAKPKKTQIK